jgi:prepilin peptidase CpaA
VHLPIVYLTFTLLLAAAAVSDFVSQRIPNWIVLALLALFLIQAGRHLPAVYWLGQLGAGGLLLVIGIVLYTLGQLGAGDAKLIAALGVWAGFSALLPTLMIISLAGLVVAGVLVAARLLPWRRLDPGERRPKALTKGGGIPFGIAIAAGSLLSASYFAPWLWS